MEYYISTAKTLCEDIEQLYVNENDINIRANRAAKTITNTLKAFRTKIRKEGFKNQDEEIHFFKYIKPKIQAYLVFYSVLQEIELAKLHMSDEELKNLIDKKLRMFRHIIRENIDFAKYYTSGMDHLDKLYFIREPKLSIISRHSATMLVDPEFNTSHDQVAADILAFDLFKKHLSIKNEKLRQLDVPNPKLKWTASKSDFVELIYALQSSSAVNYGDVEIKELCSALESIFQIKIEDPYRTFIDIANRKKDLLKFIPKLEEGFLRKVEEADAMR